MSSVEAKLRDLIQRKRNLLDQVNSDIDEITRRRDAIHNQVLELESLFPQDAEPSYQPLPQEEDDLPNIPSWGDSSASIRKGRPIKDNPQA